ncbi:bifunctional pyr operon transcriptional regulator/uracil phosphoribosyltransferase PyrR [methane-oxidizing endosymbiont of Gigantopelta aegis]|uniref:bifunctional pyr operon transcriptional regulator/uracil phosphoribosyltransferase PyrR n=1 Tax=methane-oxidizing endosymbiont of Gigantopelta aegis TaxID=2794938 RepID=UPI0018DD4263|nr:bifunctional pyr operon transcriptional regulator/uracil phosphoribosyltransferase PyrR [methane-oxidizing endosymbiont of Gigantopelta aegis]
MTLTDNDIPQLLDNLHASIQQQIEQRHLNNPIIIGIQTGGVWIAQAMHQRLAMQEPLYSMDISFYRDDFSQIGMHPQIKPSQLPPHLEGRDIILIDDVFYTGRTVRAALNELFDYGRPNQVVLAVLIERDGRQIPLRPDCAGTQITLQPGQRIKLTGPEPLGIHIQTVNQAA